MLGTALLVAFQAGQPAQPPPPPATGLILGRRPKGSFGLTVTKPGYVGGAYGRRRPSVVGGGSSE
jgi:hypothetical protein